MSSSTFVSLTSCHDRRFLTLSSWSPESRLHKPVDQIFQERCHCAIQAKVLIQCSREGTLVSIPICIKVANSFWQSIRLTEIGTQRELLEEFMVSGAEMEALLRDNYANYVVQTSVSWFRPSSYIPPNTHGTSLNMPRKTTRIDYGLLSHLSFPTFVVRLLHVVSPQGWHFVKDVPKPIVVDVPAVQPPLEKRARLNLHLPHSRQCRQCHNTTLLLATQTCQGNHTALPITPCIINRSIWLMFHTLRPTTTIGYKLLGR